MKEEIPNGARWRATDKNNGAIAEIWLERIDSGFEIWRWSYRHADGTHSPFDSDWGPSYRNCYQQVAGKLTKGTRFQRIS